MTDLRTVGIATGAMNTGIITTTTARANEDIGDTTIIGIPLSMQDR
jgi:hypothetical protein